MKRIKKHVVHLSQRERHALTQVVSQGTDKARTINRARILLLADEGYLDSAIGEILGLCRATIASMRKKYCQKRSTSILDLVHDAPRRGRPIKVDSQVETQMTMIACSDPPEGVAKWTLRLIADRLVRLEVVDALSHETVRRTLKKTN
jgi:transposase